MELFHVGYENGIGAGFEFLVLFWNSHEFQNE